MPSLESAYAQVTRGGEHLAELKVLDDEVAAEQAKSTIVEFQAERAIGPGETVEAGQVRYPQTPIAIRIRIIAGEASNCFRSALDYMVGQLAWLDSKSRQKRTQFPITNSPKEFKKARRRSLKGVSATHIAKIKKLQPYKGCGWTKFLAALSNFAKHDDLILLKHGVLISTHKFPVDPADPDPFKHKMRVDFKNAIHIAINEGLPLIATLEILKSEVTKVLDTFNPEFKV